MYHSNELIHFTFCQFVPWSPRTSITFLFAPGEENPCKRVYFRKKNSDPRGANEGYDRVQYICLNTSVFDKENLASRLYDKMDFSFSIVIFPYFSVAVFLRHLHTEFLSLNQSVMLKPVSNTKTLIEGNCSPVNCWHRVVAK